MPKKLAGSSTRGHQRGSVVIDCDAETLNALKQEFNLGPASGRLTKYGGEARFDGLSEDQIRAIESRLDGRTGLAQSAYDRTESDYQRRLSQEQQALARESQQARQQLEESRRHEEFVRYAEANPGSPAWEALRWG